MPLARFFTLLLARCSRCHWSDVHIAISQVCHIVIGQVFHTAIDQKFKLPSTRCSNCHWPGVQIAIDQVFKLSFTRCSNCHWPGVHIAIHHVSLKNMLQQCTLISYSNKKKFEDTTGVIRNCISMKDRQYNGQKNQRL